MRATWALLPATLVLVACAPSSVRAPAHHGSEVEHEEPAATSEADEARTSEPHAAQASDETGDGGGGEDIEVLPAEPPRNETLPRGDGCLTPAAAYEHEAELVRQSSEVRAAAMAAAGLTQVALSVRRAHTDAPVRPDAPAILREPWTVSRSEQGTRELAGPIVHTHCPNDDRHRSQPPVFVVDADGTIYRLALHPREHGRLSMHVCGCQPLRPPRCGAYMPSIMQDHFALPEGARWGGERTLRYPSRVVHKTYEKTSHQDCPPPQAPP